MITPAYLKKGDLIGIFAPARKIAASEIEMAIRLIEKAGFRARIGRNIFASEHQFAGSDAQRAEDLQELINDKEVRAIFCARGGYGSVRIVELIDWKKLRDDPKWIVGYSDVTVFHSHINQKLGLESLHATMPINFGDAGNENAMRTMWEALEGNLPVYSIPSHPFNHPGEAEGVLAGGNLSVLYSLIGSPSDIDPTGKILFLEDLDEYLYHIDRMMMNIKRNGWLEKISGMIIGGMTEMNDNTIPFGKNAEEIIREIMATNNIPLVFGFPAGHMADNRALIMGRKIRLSVGKEAELRF